MSPLDSLSEVVQTAPHWDSLARSSSRTGDESVEELLLELIVLRLAGDLYAVPVERVREIVRLRPVTPMPRVPAAILGALALRGEIVQVVDLRIRLGLAPQEANRESRLVILHGDDEGVTALLVDAVRDVLRVTEGSLRPTQGGTSGFVSELAVRGSDFVSIIDVDRVLNLDAE